jgi:hypothetical protein
MARTYLVLLVLAACLSLASCADRESYAKIESPGSQLLGGLLSYVAKAELTRTVPGNATVTVVENQTLPPNDQRPRRDFYAVTITPHEDLGHRGRLYAQLYNNRLYLTIFTPDDFPSYIAALEKVRGRLAAKGDRFRSGNTEYWRGVDYRTNLPFVGAQDIRLDAQNSRWISRYASAFDQHLQRASDMARLTLVRADAQTAARRST